MIKKITLLLASALLVSCGANYQNPPEQPGKTARIKSISNRSGLFTWSHYVVEAVDNQPVNYMSAWSTETKKIIVTEGRHNIVLHGSFNRSLGGSGPSEARADLDMDFVAGKTYLAKGQPEGSKLAMWIEDEATGKPASKVVKVPYQGIPVNYSTPIFIPVSN